MKICIKHWQCTDCEHRFKSSGTTKSCCPKCSSVSVSAIGMHVKLDHLSEEKREKILNMLDQNNSSPELIAQS